MKKEFRAFLDLLDDPVIKERIIKERMTISDSCLATNYGVSTTTIVNYLGNPPKKKLPKGKKYKYIDVDKAIGMRKEGYTDVEIATELGCANSTINKRLGNRGDGYKSGNKFKKYVAKLPEPKVKEEIKIISDVPYWDCSDMVETGTNPIPALYSYIK